MNLLWFWLWRGYWLNVTTMALLSEHIQNFIENLPILKELKESYYVRQLTLWLISPEFDDWYAETFVQHWKVQFLLYFIDLKKQLTLLKQILPISIPVVVHKCGSIWLNFTVVLQWSLVAAWNTVKVKTQF